MYIAPEIEAIRRYKGRHSYSAEKADMFALGRTIIVMTISDNPNFKIEEDLHLNSLV